MSRKGEDSIRNAFRKANAISTPQPESSDDCPVKPIGAKEGTCFYLNPRGEVRPVLYGKHNRNEIMGLFGERIDYLRERWGSRDPDNLGKWKTDTVTEWLITEAHKAGFFNPTQSIRGAGVWISSAGDLVVHCGDQILIPNKLSRRDFRVLKRLARSSYALIAAGCVIDKIVYAACDPLTPPDFENPASEKIAEELLSHLKQWPWRRKDTDPVLLLGFLGSAIIGGLLRWRPHINVTGDMGSGKSELEKLIVGIFGKKGVVHASSPSAAGIRQALNGAAKPVILDEGEPTPDNNHAAQILELLRLASTDEQGEVVRGSAGGKSQGWSIRGSFYLTSILHPTPKPQDKTRITFLHLNKLGTNLISRKGMGERFEYFSENSAAIRGRMILGWERYQSNFEVFSSVLENFYASMPTARRATDQIATLLACAETLLKDEVICPSAATDYIAELGLDQIVEVEPEHDHDECLSHLLTSAAPFAYSNERITIAEILARTTHGPDNNQARKELRSMGLSVYPDKDGWTELRVAHRHQGLEEIFSGTRWSNAVWAQSLKRLPEVLEGDSPTTIGGAKTRYLRIPRHVLCIDDLEQ